jgi:hypothetical protein
MVKQVEGIQAKYEPRVYYSLCYDWIGSMRFGKQVLFYKILMNKSMFW